MNEPAPQTSPAAPCALAHPPTEPCEAALPAGKGPGVARRGPSSSGLRCFAKWQPGIQPFKRLEKDLAQPRFCANARIPARSEPLTRTKYQPDQALLPPRKANFKIQALPYRRLGAV